MKHPLFVFPTLRASKRCIAICNTLFGNTHHLHNRANAFRHALWNILIVRYCVRKPDNSEGVISWAKRITDWHETFSVNEPLDRAMDKHNNAIGRLFALSVLNETEQKVIETVQNMAKSAKKVIKIEEIDQFPNELVYLNE